MCGGWDWVGAGAGYLCVCGECLVVSFPKNYILYGSWKKTIQLCKDVVEDLKHSWFFSVFCPHCIQAHCVPAWVNQNRLPLLKVSENLHYERIGFSFQFVLFFSNHFQSFPAPAYAADNRNLQLVLQRMTLSSRSQWLGQAHFIKLDRYAIFIILTPLGSTEFLILPRLVVHLGFHGSWL